MPHHRMFLVESRIRNIEAEIERLFDHLILEEFATFHLRRPRAWMPPMDVLETDEAYIVRLEIAGMNEQEFEITYQNGILAIRGTRAEPFVPNRRYHQVQIRYGEFFTAVRFRDALDEDRIEAEYESGFLTIWLPKRPSSPPEEPSS
ncbi:MAG: Hsp20/alpha crystallin family protein [Ardenticatenia bacterium]|nr:Hsp20/alpha crystallin family protein [Ardenticatenia bacterium]